MTRAARREALLALASDRGHEAVLLTSFADVAWYTGGFDVRVDRSGSAGSSSVLVSGEGEWVLTDAIEAPRLRAEEPTLAGMEIVERAWTDGPDVGPNVATDLDIAPVRRVLDDEAIDRYRVLGADLRAVMDEVAPALSPTMTELEAAAMVASAAWRRDGHTPVLLAAGAERIPRFRHPLPTAAPLGERVMLVACLERGGLFASLTRYVHFSPPDAELGRRLELTDGLLVMAREASVPGRTLGEIFEDLRQGYADAGFPDEWKLHHQGGMAGYRSREAIGKPGEPTVVQPGMAFAWNPSITGAKSEETFVLPVGGGAAEVLT